MKVLMQGRLDLYDIGGGDKVQIEQTTHELKKLGVEIDISTDLSTDYTKYDIIHIFQLDWTPETYLYAKKAHDLGKPVVLSPIHHSVREVKLFDDLYAFGFRRLSRRLFSSQFARDTFKNVYRSVFNFKKFYPTLISIVKGLKNLQRLALIFSDKILVQTELEAKDINSTYKVNIDWVKIPNGVGEAYINAREYNNLLPFENYIYCVGRIEARKNQLNIIEGVKVLRKRTGNDLQLVFAGPRNLKHHMEYNSMFDEALRENSWVHYLGRVPYELNPSYFHFAKVGVSASWFETSGLTSLEALYCGANPVAAGDRAKEYLGEYAFYCQPDDIDSIAQAIELAYNAERPVIPDTLKSEFTWKTAAKKTFDVYTEVLNK